MAYRHTIDATSYVFADLRELMAKASPRCDPATGWPGSPPAAPPR
jgi:hypothetical protein